jgi:hypothetical protein
LLFAENMQVEDPRKQWEIEQERMLKDYLMVSQHHLQVCEKHLLNDGFVHFLDFCLSALAS